MRVGDRLFQHPLEVLRIAFGRAQGLRVVNQVAFTRINRAGAGGRSVLVRVALVEMRREVRECCGTACRGKPVFFMQGQAIRFGAAPGFEVPHPSLVFARIDLAGERLPLR
ncbi:hypothetical protein D3C72_2131720 [compost metagenome]